MPITRWDPFHEIEHWEPISRGAITIAKNKCKGK